MCILAMWCVGLQLQYGKFALSIAAFLAIHLN